MQQQQQQSIYNCNNNSNRHSLSVAHSTTMSSYQPPQPSWWNTGLGLGTGSGSGSVRRNSCMFTMQEDHDQSFNNQYYYPESHTYTPTNNVSSNKSLNNTDIPIIQIDPVTSAGAPPNGSIPNNNNNNTTASSPTHPSNHSPTQPYYRGRDNSSIAAARNKLRIMAMLDDVRKKRELRDRRKSDIMAYLDDLIVPDDPALANAAAGALKLYRRRFKIYQFLNHPSTGTPWSITYHVMVFVIVFVCLILTICATIQQAPLQEKAIKSVGMLEKVVVVWFNIEFGLGLWSCACKKRYRGYMGKVRYLTVPSRLIDLVILSFTTIVLVFNPSKTGHEVFVVSAFRGFHRFFQVAQVLTLNRPLKPWKVLASVIYDQREQLFIIYYTEFIVLCVLAYVAFLVERDTNENFNSIADAMWWAIVTLSTVGYGDRVPVTWVGKIISTMFTILGVAIFALPAGIIGTGLALKIEEVERNQIRNRKKVAAAILIQRAYRSWKAHQTYELVSKFFRERPMPIYKQHDYLSMAQKFIALIQFCIALNKFRELLRPLDLKTVMQSYSDGQTEVLLRTKLVQQSIEELARRVEMTENRVANMSMRIETKQNTFERRIDHIRQLMESCHRQLLANHLLVELLRTNNNNRFQVPNTMTTGRRHPRQQFLPQQQPSINKQSLLSLNNRPKTVNPGSTTNKSTTTSTMTSQTSTNQQPQQMSISNNSNSNSNESSNQNSSIQQDSTNNKSSQITTKPTTTSSSSSPSNTSNMTPMRPLNLPLKQMKKNLYPITSSGSNTSVDESDEDLINQESLKKTPVAIDIPTTTATATISSSSSSSATSSSSTLSPNNVLTINTNNLINNTINNNFNNNRNDNQRHHSPNQHTQPPNPYRSRRMSL